jgi:hypothetical protein
VTSSAEILGAPAPEIIAPLLSDRPRRRPRGDGDRWSRWAVEEGRQEAVDRVA